MALLSSYPPLPELTTSIVMEPQVHGPPQLCRIPQKTYVASEAGCHRKPTVSFYSHGQPGIGLVEIMRQPNTLEDPKARVDFGERVKISHRLRVRGERDYNFDKQVPACRSNGGRDSLTRDKVARHVAQSVQQCMKKTGGVWVIDGWTIRFRDLVLLDLKNVSKGSWQPTLAAYLPTVNLTPDIIGFNMDFAPFLCSEDSIC